GHARPGGEDGEIDVGERVGSEELDGPAIGLCARRLERSEELHPLDGELPRFEHLENLGADESASSDDGDPDRHAAPSASRTRRPISAQPIVRSPGAAMSAVRCPAATTEATASSMAAAAAGAPSE